MKSLKILALSVSMAFIGAITFNSCTDPCKDVTCQNGGTCNEGDCDCVTGYEGTSCETEQRTKFIASYSVDEVCGPDQADYNSSITASTTDVTKIIITNFGGYGSTVSATIDASGTSFTIPEQTVATTIGGDATFSGNGTISGDVVTITYNVTAGSLSDNCTKTCTKQ